MRLIKPTRRSLLIAAPAIIAAPSLARAFGYGFEGGCGGYNSACIAASYTGPGDIQTGWLAWYGLRGFSAAYAAGSNPAIDVVDQAGANTLTVNILSNGNLDLSSVAAWVAAHSVTTILISKAYDQSGGGLHVTQATLVNMPTLVTGSISGITSTLPGMKTGTSVFSKLTSSGSISSSAAPYNMSVVAERTGLFTQIGGIIIAATKPTGLFFWSTANLVVPYAGSGGGGKTASDGSFHAIQANYATDPNTTLYIDGTLSSTIAGIGATTVAGAVSIGSPPTTTQFVQGFILEAGICAGDQTTHNSALNSNQHTYWGF